MYLLDVLFSVFLAVALILLLPTFLYRKIIALLQPYLRQDLAGIIPNTSTAIAQIDQDGNHQSIIVAKLCFKDKVSIHRLISEVDRLILQCKVKGGSNRLRFPEMKQYPVDWMGYKFWKDEDHFSLEKHIFEKEGPEDGNMEREAAKILMKNFPPKFSLWDFTIFHGASSSTGILRMHHALADGYSMLHILQIMTQMEPADLRVVDPSKATFRGPSWKRLPTDIRETVVELIGSTLVGHPLKNPNPPQTDRWTLSRPVIGDVDRLFIAKAKLGVSFSTIVYGILFGGLKRWSEKNGMTLPDLGWAAPVLAPGHPGTLTNYYSFMSAKFPINAKGTVARMKAVERDLADLKLSWKPLIGYLGHRLHGSQVNWLGKFINNYGYAPVFITYFPLTRGYKRLEMAGEEITDVSFFLRFQGQPGIVFSVSSFSGTLKIRFVGDRSIFSEDAVEEVCKMLEQEISELYDGKLD